jgi:hypothetical protein
MAFTRKSIFLEKFLREPSCLVNFTSVDEDQLKIDLFNYFSKSVLFLSERISENHYFEEGIHKYLV